VRSMTQAVVQCECKYPLRKPLRGCRSTGGWHFSAAAAQGSIHWLLLLLTIESDPSPKLMETQDKFTSG
jgi:hypothetical protein